VEARINVGGRKKGSSKVYQISESEVPKIQRLGKLLIASAPVEKEPKQVEKKKPSKKKVVSDDEDGEGEMQDEEEDDEEEEEEKVNTRTKKKIVGKK